MLLKARQYKSSQLALLVLIFTVFFAGHVFAGQKQSSATTKLKVLFETKVKSANTDEVRALITAGADVDVITKHDATPLIMASKEGHTEIVKLLLAAKADINKARITNGFTPLLTASQDGHTEVVRLLLQAKANPNKASTSTDGATPLLMASQEGHTDVVQLLIAAKADINKARPDGATPLAQASLNGHADIVRLLLAAQGDINKADTDGVTPLMLASQNGYTEVVRLLLEAKADINAIAKVNGNEYSALRVARGSGHNGIVKLLKKYGAKELSTRILWRPIQ